MRGRVSLSLSLVGAAPVLPAVSCSAASFTDTTENPQTVSAATDFVAPTASTSMIAKTSEGVTGYIKAGGTYYVYANVTDSGKPASGVASVTADVSSITPGQTEAPLAAGGYVADGVSYNYRSAELKAKTSLSAGSKSYTLDLEDSAENTNSQSFPVMVYGAFKGSEFKTDNASGGTEGKPEKGDTVSFEFNNVPEAKTIVSDWNGSGTKSVTVSIADGSEND